MMLLVLYSRKQSLLQISDGWKAVISKAAYQFVKKKNLIDLNPCVLDSFRKCYLSVLAKITL